MTSQHLLLHPEPPFDFDLTAGYHTYFQGRSGADSLSDGTYRRLLDLDGRLALASVRSIGTVDAPELELHLQGKNLREGDAHSARYQVEWMLGSSQRLRPFYEAADASLADLCRRFWGLHLPRTATLFEGLTLAILGQQISAAVARMMRTLLIERLGAMAEFGGVEYYAFPRPEAIYGSTIEELRTLKLTQRKAEYLHGLAGAALQPEWTELPSLEDGQLVVHLTALRGLGPWTAQWALIRALARPDALPLGDLALRRGVSRLFAEGEAVSDADVERLTQVWRPWRSYATTYLFAAMRSGVQ